MPAVRALVVTEHEPPVVSEQVPTIAPSVPSVTVTRPVGTPVVASTRTVTVTLRPKTDGLSEEVTEVVVGAGIVVCVSADEAAGTKFASPA